jgi:hypothetical protein
LLHGRQTASPTQLRTFFASQLIRQMANFSMSHLLSNSSHSCLFLIHKQLQLFNFLSLGKRELAEKVGNTSQCEDNILPDILFAQINHNASQAGHGYTWSPPNVFDLMWQSVMRLRLGILRCLIPDSFRIFDNVLPNEYLQFICMQSFNLVPYMMERQSSRDWTTKSDFFVTKKQLADNEVGRHVEVAMRLLLTGIAPDEKEATIQPVAARKQVNLSELSVRVHRKPRNLSFLATAGGSVSSDPNPEDSRVDNYDPPQSVMNRSEYSVPATSMG